MQQNNFPGADLVHCDSFESTLALKGGTSRVRSRSGPGVTSGTPAALGPGWPWVGPGWIGTWLGKTASWRAR